MRLNVVDFPAPLGPMSACRSPCATLKFKSRMIEMLPKLFWTSFTSMAGAVMRGIPFHEPPRALRPKPAQACAKSSRRDKSSDDQEQSNDPCDRTRGIEAHTEGFDIWVIGRIHGVMHDRFRRKNETCHQCKRRNERYQIGRQYLTQCAAPEQRPVHHQKPCEASGRKRYDCYEKQSEVKLPDRCQIAQAQR